MGWLTGRRARRGVDAVQLADAGVPGPDAVEVRARHVRAGGWCSATLAVTGYPAEVGPGWLEPLASYSASSETDRRTLASAGRFVPAAR